MQTLRSLNQEALRKQTQVYTTVIDYMISSQPGLAIQVTGALNYARLWTATVFYITTKINVMNTLCMLSQLSKIFRSRNLMSSWQPHTDQVCAYW